MFNLIKDKNYTVFLANNTAIVGKAVDTNRINTGNNIVELNFHYIVSVVDGDSAPGGNNVPHGIYTVKEYQKLVTKRCMLRYGEAG